MKTGVRLQKIIAAAGITSRRDAEEMIRAGRVRVNGKPAYIGMSIEPASDSLMIDGRILTPAPRPCRAYLLNKPRGRVCTRAGGEGRTVFELFPDCGAGLLTAGRLDKNSEGALLLSDNGDWINRWTHPSLAHEKTYRVTVSGPIRGETFKQLEASIIIDGYRTRPARVRFLRSGEKPGRMILEFVLQEGRNRQIRKLCEQANLTVRRLVRIQIGPLTLSGLKPGCWRPLSSAEIQALNNVSPSGA